MASELYFEDPRTGCWTPAEGATAEAVYERLRGELPHGSTLVQVCRADGCVNPGHQRPTFHVSVESIADAFEVPVELLTSPAEEPAVVEPPKADPDPAPAAPVKRGPGRPRKTR